MHWTTSLCLLASTIIAFIFEVVADNSNCDWFQGVAENPQDQTFWNIAQEYNLTHDVLGATVLALIYSTPLNQYNSPKIVFPTNQLQIDSGPRNGSSNSPAPNTDVIYGHMSFDLAVDNIVITVPPFQPDRFYEFSFYDIFQDDFANIGVISGDKPGEYLLRPTPGSGLYGLTSQDCPSGYIGCVNSPGYQGHMLPRVEVKNTTDVTYVVKYLHEIAVGTVNRSILRVKPIDPSDWEGFSQDRFVNALQAVALLGARNPPQNAALASSLPQLMLCAGVNLTSQSYNPVVGVNVSRAARIWQRIEDAYLLSSGIIQELNNGWQTPNNTAIGSFLNGTALIARAESQVLGNLANTGDQAVYATPNTTRLVLDDQQAFLLSFSGKPLIYSTGFWNLEAYNVVNGSVSGLVSNPDNIYSVGINGNLTYSDGTKVYGDSSANEPFQILLQSYTNPPPQNWTGNWLPTPEAGIEFRIVMRLYGPEAGLLNGSYVYPTQQIIPAITAVGTSSNTTSG